VTFVSRLDVEGTVDLATISATSIAPQDGAIYYGSGQIGFTEGKTGGTDTGSKTFGFKDASLTKAASVMYFPLANMSYTVDFYGTTTLTATSSSRVMSFYAVPEALFVGHGGATVVGSNTGTTNRPLKGNLTYRNLNISITTPNDFVHDEMGAETDSNIVLEGNSSITATSALVTGMKVVLETKSDYGYVRLMCGNFDGSPLAVDTSKIAAGHTVAYYINGSDTPVSEFPSDLCPASNSTVTVKAVVV
jgi:hypothetical protein